MPRVYCRECGAVFGGPAAFTKHRYTKPCDASPGFAYVCFSAEQLMAKAYTRIHGVWWAPVENTGTAIGGNAPVSHYKAILGGF